MMEIWLCRHDSSPFPPPPPPRVLSPPLAAHSPLLPSLQPFVPGVPGHPWCWWVLEPGCWELVPGAERGSWLVRTVPGELGAALLSVGVLGVQRGAHPNWCCPPKSVRHPALPGWREGRQ